MTATADAAEMKKCFEGWDPKLKMLLKCVNSCLKWKTCYMSELETWTKDSVALLGDACHPTLPHQAQGAAIAVKDEAALGILIGSLSQSTLEDRKAHVPKVLQLYKAMRKRRTTTNVQETIENRQLFQMADEGEVEIQNKELLDVDLVDINKKCRWGYADLSSEAVDGL
jgi:salicylate hydroxylase